MMGGHWLRKNALKTFDTEPVPEGLNWDVDRKPVLGLSVIWYQPMLPFRASSSQPIKPK